MEILKLSWIDYTFFVIMFGISIAVGLYFGFFTKQNTVADYLQGGRKLRVFPVSMSLVASLLSAINLIGLPAEIYLFGSQYSMMLLSIFMIGFIANFVYLPVFYNLQAISVYEYLEHRFDKTTRTIGSILFMCSNLVMLPIIIYAPSLAFNYVTGFELHFVAPLMSLICIFYTTIGGIKAVVWADTLQLCVTLCTCGCVLIMGTISVGGVSALWKRSLEGNRIEFFNMDPDPTIRNTFWTVVVGNLFFWMFQICIHPSTIQRLLSVPTVSDSKKILIIFITFTIITKFIGAFSGLIIFAKYYDCDPLSAGYIQKPDQIMPYYVLDVAAQVPGLSGLFVAGLFTTTLSTLSTYINTLAGTMYEDFIAPFMPVSTSEKKASTIMKGLTILIGLASVALVFVVERLGTIVQMINSLLAITSAPLLGVFTLGMLFPTANKNGAKFGTIGGFLCLSAIAIPAQIYMWNGMMRPIPRPLQTYGCNTTSNLTSLFNRTASSITHSQNQPFWLFRISFYYYVLIGMLATIVVGLFVSWLTKGNDAPVNTALLSPCIHRFLTKSAGYDAVLGFELMEDKNHQKIDSQKEKL